LQAAANLSPAVPRIGALPRLPVIAAGALKVSTTHRTGGDTPMRFEHARHWSRTGAALALLIAALLMAGCTGEDDAEVAAGTENAETSRSAADEKIVITSLDELPQHTYKIDGTVSGLLGDEAAFGELYRQVKADLESDLARYQIDDDATMQAMYGTMANLAMLAGDHETALVYLDKARALEDKEAARLTSGLVSRSIIAARAEVGGQADDAAFRAAFRDDLTKRVAPLPWDVVQDNIEQAKGRAEILNPNFLTGAVQAQIDPVVAKSGELNSDLARRVMGIKRAFVEIMPLNDVIAAVYGDYIAAHAVAKENIWPAREVTLEPNLGYRPTVIGIWDSGVDVEIFGEQMWVNTAETPGNGVDDDGNGFVDDIHGIAFDVEGRDNASLLHPVTDQAGKVEQSQRYMQGYQHVLANIDSEAATELRSYLGSLAPDEVGEFIEGLNFYGLYAHGTHVAGIAAAGNPYARILAARISFDYHTPPMAMTHEIARRHADSYRRTTAYFQAAGVRVVNMSWGWGFKEIESSLEANGVGADAEERAKLAREMLDILSEGLEGAMKSTPDILYVVAAGNADNDVEFDIFIPAAYDLPNLMVVAAVDQAGDPTDFTSGGRNVKVYASGFEVDSWVPGGKRMSMSGTSMASPQVCNLAGKIFAKHPEMTPAQVIDAIEDGAEINPEHPEIKLLDPRSTLAAN
jgi:subtilisin family serine protease